MAPAGALSMCHALGARASSVMAARVRLKMRTGVSPLAVLLVVCAVLAPASGMFEHRHCDHQHPRAHEVSAIKRSRSGAILTSPRSSVLHGYGVLSRVPVSLLSVRVRDISRSPLIAADIHASADRASPPSPVHAAREFLLWRGGQAGPNAADPVAVTRRSIRRVRSHVFAPSLSLSLSPARSLMLRDSRSPCGPIAFNDCCQTFWRFLSLHNTP